MENNAIYSSDVLAIAKNLKYWKHLKKLNIRNNNLGCHANKLAEGQKYCAESAILVSLEICSRLQTLQLDGNKFNESTITALVDLVKSFSNIQILSLTDTKFDDRCAAILIDGLKSCVTLQTLDISRNPYKTKDHRFVWHNTMST